MTVALLQKTHFPRPSWRLRRQEHTTYCDVRPESIASNVFQLPKLKAESIQALLLSWFFLLSQKRAAISMLAIHLAISIWIQRKLGETLCVLVVLVASMLTRLNLPFALPICQPIPLSPFKIRKHEPITKRKHGRYYDLESPMLDAKRKTRRIESFV